MANIPNEKLEIGRALLAGGPITQQFLQQELQASGKAGGALGKALLQSGFPAEEELVAAVLRSLRIPKINARNTKIPLETVCVIPESVAKSCRVLALDKIGKILVVVTPDLRNAEALAEVRRQTECLITPIQCAAEGFEEIVADYYQRLAQSGLSAAQTLEERAAGGGGSSSGVAQAIPAGSEREDRFWRLYMSAGPLPAAELLM